MSSICHVQPSHTWTQRQLISQFSWHRPPYCEGKRGQKASLWLVLWRRLWPDVTNERRVFHGPTKVRIESLAVGKLPEPITRRRYDWWLREMARFTIFICALVVSPTTLFVNNQNFNRLFRQREQMTSVGRKRVNCHKGS